MAEQHRGKVSVLQNEKKIGFTWRDGDVVK
jgi:hypothetical protein